MYDAGPSARGVELPTGIRAAHAFTTRVYYADTDFSGVVYYGRYLEFLERGRSDLLHDLGIRHADMLAGRTALAGAAVAETAGDARSDVNRPLESSASSEPLAWVVRRIEIDYRGSARIEDEITVSTGVTEARGARVRMAQRITLGERTILDAIVEAALITLDGRPQRLPQAWLDRLSPLTERIADITD